MECTRPNGGNNFLTHHLYISPHLDDALFSCGGCILQQTAQGDRVTVLTIFAGDPSDRPLSSFAEELHQRWGIDRNNVAVRRAEDRVACARLGATAYHMEFPESIYRFSAEFGFFYDSEEGIFGSVHPAENKLIEEIRFVLRKQLHPSLSLYAPLGLGGHVDHRLVRMVVDQLKAPVHYYFDFPYAARYKALPEDVPLPTGDLIEKRFAPEEISEWANVICEYRTQLSTFWSTYEELLEELKHYALDGIGLYLPSADESSV